MKSGSFLRGSITLLALLAGALSHAHAAIPTPEIDPSFAAGGLTLLAGTVLMIRGRRKQ